MKRNSTTLFLESPGAKTPVPWVDNAPDFSRFTNPTLRSLQKAWQDFLNSGEALEIIADPVPAPDTTPQWTEFNTALLSDFYWLTIASQFSRADIRTGIVAAAAVANADALQVAYYIGLADLQAQQIAIDPQAIAAWQALADQYNIPVSFAIP